jgi:hypothetical protein
MQQIKDNFLAQLVIIYTRYLLGGGFVFASMIKIKGLRFTTESGENEAFGTAFHFFETMYRTGIYWQFIGWGQLLAGFLLMTQRYAKLGAVVKFPIILNVFVITVSMDFNYTPVITGMMLFANIVLLVWHWNELRVLVNLPAISDKSNRLEYHKSWEITGLLLFLFTAGYRIFTDRYDPIFWFGICVLIGLGGLVFGLKKTKNKKPEALNTPG